MDNSTITEKHKWYPNIFGLITLFSTVLFLLESKGNIDVIILISSAALFQFILRLPIESVKKRDYRDFTQVGVFTEWDWYKVLTVPNIIAFSEDEKINKYWKLSYKIVIYLVLNIVLAYAVWNPKLEPQEMFISVFEGALLFLLGYLIFGLFLFFKAFAGFILETIIND
ncbi:MAG: hypothetical protein ACJAXI_000210 [Crocinitomicaceae bacterium]|jgi:hypothetical protein|tara:strand:- start:828 stop:1334 length:507 start_codon:yes stop_codon:yes gene_type:complete